MQLVLIVEDDTSIAASLDRLLRGSGFETHTVHRGAEGLAFIRERAVDLILLDLSLPDISGLEILRAIHGPGGPASPPPVIVFSATDDDATRAEAVRLGAKEFVPKSQCTRLLSAIKTHLGKRDS
jgi:DNA-binding response OmpR family regulator